MATAELKSFKPKRGNRTNFQFCLGIEDERTYAVRQGFQPKVCNIIEKTKLSQKKFHHVTHIPVSTIKRRLKNGERFSTQESDAIYRLAMPLIAMTELFNDEQRALEWMRESVYGVGWKATFRYGQVLVLLHYLAE